MNLAGKRSYSPHPDKPVLLLIEGADAFYFVLSQFLSRKEFAVIHLYDFGSISELNVEIETLVKAPRFRECIRAVGVMRDAEADVESAIASVCGAFENVGLEVPRIAGEVRPGSPACGLHLFPDNINPGCLENACLSAYGNAEDLDCAQRFLDCAKRVAGSPNWKAKALVHTMIAIGEKPEMTLGDSAKKGMWNSDSPPLVLIENFLRHLCAAAKLTNGVGEK